MDLSWVSNKYNNLTNQNVLFNRHAHVPCTHVPQMSHKPDKLIRLCNVFCGTLATISKWRDLVEGSIKNNKQFNVWFFFMDFYIIFFRNFPDLIPLMFFFVGIICFFDLLIWSFRKCRNRKTGQEYAVKIVSRRIDCSQELKTIQLCQGHSNIIKIHGEFKDVVSKTHNSQLTTHNSQLTTNNNSHRTRTPHTAHSTPHTAHRTQHTAHRTQHTAHRTPHTAHRTPHTAKRTTQNALRQTQNTPWQNAKRSVAERFEFCHRAFCVLPQSVLRFATKLKTLCGKTQNALWQNAKRSVAKRKTLCGKTQNALWQNAKCSVAKRKTLCGKTLCGKTQKRSVAKRSVGLRIKTPFLFTIFQSYFCIFRDTRSLLHPSCSLRMPSLKTFYLYRPTRKSLQIHR